MRWVPLVFVLPGCSFMFVHGPPAGHEKLEYFDCSSAWGTQFADGVGATVFGLTTIGLTAPPDPGEEKTPATAVAIAGSATALFAASAIYGVYNTRQCAAAKRDLAARIRVQKEKNAALEALRKQQELTAPESSGCSKDTDCKGARICVAFQCVDPPAPVTPPPASEAAASASEQAAPPGVATPAPTTTAAPTPAPTATAAPTPAPAAPSGTAPSPVTPAPAPTLSFPQSR